MKEDQSQKDGDVNLDSVPFPDDKADGKCHCHEHDAESGSCCGEGNDEQCQCKGADSDLYAKLDAVAQENAALRDMLVRSAADFDNFRKRVIREKEEARKSANADFAAALIPVLDTMALALDAARKHHPEAAAVLDGIDMIMTQFKGTLKAQGVDELNPVGGDFDPNLHESIAQQPSDDVPEGKVSIVARVGYTLNGKLLRPASVILSSGPKA
ncbi:MAG: nucleotide exchange factor GrpE [Opitutales bacterium]|nr:nucleotide exchange factor GrpE [Opitutales bacterium]